ncbi:MAG: hypothetical protein ACPH5P_03160 [Akkermansiaceae bacterium]
MKAISALFSGKLLMLYASCLPILLASCGSDDVMQVRQFHLRSIQVESMQRAPMIRGEQMYRMRGEVSIEERNKCLGQYYSVKWKHEGSRGASRKILMDYRQAATGSKILSMSRELPADANSGLVEFSVAGESYRTRGRVLAWRIRLLSDKEVIEEKRSYLWR